MELTRLPCLLSFRKYKLINHPSAICGVAWCWASEAYAALTWLPFTQQPFLTHLLPSLLLTPFPQLVQWPSRPALTPIGFSPSVVKKGANVRRGMKDLWCGHSPSCGLTSCCSGTGLQAPVEDTEGHPPPPLPRFLLALVPVKRPLASRA